MHLFVLVAVFCSMQSGDCTQYGTAVYKKREDCEYAAAYMRKHPTDGVVMIYCANTSQVERVKRKAKS